MARQFLTKDEIFRVVVKKTASTAIYGPYTLGSAKSQYKRYSTKNYVVSIERSELNWEPVDPKTGKLSSKRTMRDLLILEEKD